MGQGRRTGLRRTAAAGLLACSAATALCVAWAPAARAQEDRGGPRFTFGVATTLRASDNLGLNVSSNGTSLVSETELSFGFESITRTQEFRVNISDEFTFGFGPDAPDSASFRDPEAELAYVWRGANAMLTFDANLQIDDLADDLTNVDADDPDSELALGDGTLTKTNLRFSFATGLEGPFGTRFTLSQGRQDYSNTGNPDLIDSVTTSGSATLFFRPDHVTELSVSYSHSFLDTDDLVGTERTTRRLSFGASRAIDPVTTISGAIGWSLISEDWTAVPLSLPDSDGMTVNLAYDRELPTGKIAVEFDYTLTNVGYRADINVVRDIDLLTGALSFTIGATQIENADLQPVGAISYRREWPDQTFRLDLSSTVVIANSNAVRRRNVASIGYDYQINEIEALEFGISYGGVTDAGAGPITDRTRFTAEASYHRELTPDWSLETGYVHRIRHIEGTGTARANELFLRLERDFSWRP